jgi:tetratricopeptide (TPR) repeat protein
MRFAGSSSDGNGNDGGSRTAYNEGVPPPPLDPPPHLTTITGVPRPPRSPHTTTSPKLNHPVLRKSKSKSSKQRSTSKGKGPSHKTDSGSEPSRLLQDPTPTHLAVVTDDLSNSFVPDFTSLNLAKCKVALTVHEGSDDLEASIWNDENYNAKNTADRSTLTATTAGSGSFFWRNNKGSRKVSCADVASVGNASDTACCVYTGSNTSTSTANHMIMNSSNNIGNNNNNNISTVRVSGRDLHESAKLSLNAGDYNKALPQFQAILAAQVERFGTLHPSVGAAMHNVGVCRQRMKQFDNAEELFLKAIQIRQETLGPEHLEVAASLSKLGQTRVFQHKLEEAFEDLRLACKIARLNLGYEHKTVAQMLCHTACLYFEAGELFAAQASFQDALDIYRNIWSDQVDRDGCMAQLTDTLCNIGSIQNRRKRFDDAVQSFKEALDLQRGIIGHDHPRVVATLDNLAFSYSKTRDYASALTCYKKMLRAQISHSGTFSDECFETFRKQVVMYEKLKRFPDAVEDVKETLRLQKSMLPRNCDIVVHTKMLLEELTEKMKRTP